MSRRITIGLLIAVAVFAIAIWTGGFGREAPVSISEEEGVFPLTLIDGMRREVTIARQPQRVVSLSPGTTEIVFALGLGQMLVGATNYCDYPAAALDVPRVGGFSDPSVEVVASLEPDLVIATSMHEEAVRQMEDLGLTVVVVFPRDIRGVLGSIQMMGEAMGARDEALALVDSLQARIDRVSGALSALSNDDKPLVYYEVFSDPLMSVGPNTLIHEVIESAGGINLAWDADTDYPQFSAETILERNPDIMIYPTFHGTDALTEEALLSRAGWQEIKAVKNRRYYSIDANTISRPGPRIVDALEDLARVFHPEIPW